MLNIKPISDLRNYTEVLRDVAVGESVFLTKNGCGKFAIIDINEYESLKASLKLMSQLSKDDLVFVSRVLYGRRDYLRILFKDLPEE